MSCMIQLPENTAAIADFVAGLLNMGSAYEYFGFEAPEGMGLCLHDCRKAGRYEEALIYNALASLNLAAYLGRYPEEDDYSIADYKPSRIHKRVDYTGGEFVVDEWHYKILKMIQFFNYQCFEDATHEHPLFKAMQELENVLYRFIVNNTGIMSRLPWA